MGLKQGCARLDSGLCWPAISPARPSPYAGPLLALLACALVLACYAAFARLGTAVFGNDDPGQAVYNRMADGFLGGHLYLRRDVPPAFAQLRDPYDPAQNGPFRDPPYYLYDLSYFRGRMYAYFGAAPALLLFLPYHLLTGGYLSYKAAALAFAAAAFLAWAWLAWDVRRRCAPAMPDWLLAAALLAFGLAGALPSLLARVDVWEVPVAAVSACGALALLALWQAWNRPAARVRWLALASLALGLAIGCRPTALVLCPLLAWFLGEARQAEGRWNRRLVLAAALPLGGCLALLGAYNYGRFGSVLDTGHRYQLAGGQYESRLTLFRPAYVWDNLRIYFLHAAPWLPRFPFVGEAGPLRMSEGHSDAELTFGLLLNLPLAWCALRSLPAARSASGVGFAVRAVLLAAAAETAFFLAFFEANIRYEVEFLLPLLFLSVLGLIAAEAAPGGRRRLRAPWLALAAASAAFVLGHAAHRALKARLDSYGWAMAHRQPQAALRHIGTLLALEPANGAFHNDRGVALSVAGDAAGGMREFARAVELDPGSSGAHCNLGFALLNHGDAAGALAQFRRSLELDPANAGARAGLALLRPDPAR
ncbi:MAG TPA: tetratricopeptide repeat protein [Opitutaceae bacterium]|nr:tetratricopeptide repeat protein [Opitutaceae bacterium]